MIRKFSAPYPQTTLPEWVSEDQECPAVSPVFTRTTYLCTGAIGHQGAHQAAGLGGVMYAEWDDNRITDGGV